MLPEKDITSSSSRLLRDAKMPPVWRGVPGTLVAAVFWCGITGVFVGFASWGTYWGVKASLFYKQTDGQIVEARTDPTSTSDGEGERPAVKYTYVVNDRQYTGTRFNSLGDVKVNKRDLAADFTLAHPPGSWVPVYYDPADPSQAILDPSIPSILMFLWLFLQPFILIGLGLMGSVFYTPLSAMRVRRFFREGLQPPCRIPGWGLVTQEPLGMVFKPGPAGPRALMAFVMGYGGTCILGVFANIPFMTTAGSEGSGYLPFSVGATFALAVGIGVLCAAVSLRRSRQRSDVVLDSSLGRLSVTGPVRDESIELRDVQSFTLQMVMTNKRFRNQSDPSTVPLLGVRTADSRDVPLHLFGTGKYEPLTAAKLAEELSALTGKPVIDFAGHFAGAEAKRGKVSGCKLMDVSGFTVSKLLSKLAGSP